MGLSAFLSTQVIDTTSVGRSVMTAADAAAARAAIGAGTSSFDGAYSSLSGIPSTFTPAAHNQAWSTITSTPTTLAGYGITDAQPLDSDLTAIAALTTTAFGRSVLTQADGPAIRTLIGAGTSSFDGAYASLSGIPSSFTPSSHTHTASNITDFGEAVDDEVATLLQAGSGITLTYNDAANTLTISATGGGSGITSLGGQTGSTQTFQTATTGTDFTISSSANVHTFAIPDASASARGLVTTGAQTFAGAKTFSSIVNFPAGSTSGPSVRLNGNDSGLYASGTAIRVAANGAYTAEFASTLITFNVGISGTSNVIEQRNSTNAQTLNIYGTYTSTTSLERLSIKHTATQVEIGQQRGSAGGSDRPIVLGHYGSGSTITAAITIATNGVVTLAQTPSIPGYAPNARAFAMGLIF